MNDKRAIILSAPSGAGKTTLGRHLLKTFPRLTLSVSATSRAPRGAEQDGREYHFLTHEAFREKIDQDAFVEWEEVYRGVFYGTLKSELDRIWGRGDSILFDVDVKGGIRLKQIFGHEALSIFVQPPSLEVLYHRLHARGTDTPESIQKRLDKAQEEITYAPHFDVIITNDRLDLACAHIEQAVEKFLG